MKKVTLILFLTFITSYFSYNIVFEKNVFNFNPLKLNITYEYEKSFDLKIEFSNTEYFYKVQNLFFKKIKIKTGEQNFKFFIKIPLYNSEVGLGYEYSTDNNIFGIIKYNFFNTLTFKSNSSNFFQKANLELSVPTIVIGSINNIIFANDKKTVFFTKFGFKSLRFLNLPLFLNFGRMFETGIQLSSFDKYYGTGIWVGIAYDGTPYILGDVSNKIKILKYNFLIGGSLMYNDSLKYRIYLTSTSIPLFLYINEIGGGIFVQL